MRLVDADELMIKFEAAQKEAARHGREFASCFYDHGGEVSTNWYCVEDMVDNAPTVDAAPVVHGEWIEILSINHTYKCSECGRLLVNITDGKNNVAKHYPYCHCGAKMDGIEYPALERKELP